jgi:branched-chain amino acid transport system ATP-binding protein
VVTSATPILEVRDLTVAFGALRAVSDVSFAARRGAITSVIGPNGAGKSTLFNLVSGALRPLAGAVVFDGVDITGKAADRLVRAGLSRSFQITNLFAELTVHENLRLAAQVLEPRARALLPARFSVAASERVDELIERFRLREKAFELAGFLSHGEQRRLEIAVAMASRPRLLLLDEPTQGMSHQDTQETAELIRELAKDLSILLIEHDIELVMNLSDHVVVLHQGRLLAEGAPSAVRGNPDVQSAYFGTRAHATN